MLKITKFDTISSTNDVAKKIANDTKKEHDHLILAKSQTSGRGRLSGRTWASPCGNFYGTYIINLQKHNFQLEFASALNSIALYSVYEELLKISKHSAHIAIKLPNDILINKKKISGVLVEIEYPYAFVGIGINTNISPIETSTNIHDEFGATVDLSILGQDIHKSMIERIRSYAIV